MQTAGPRNRWLVGLVAVAALAGLGWLTSEPAAGPVVAAARAAASVPDPLAPVASAGDGVPAVAAAAPANPNRELPPGVSLEQWTALEAEMKTRPDGPAELARMRDYLAWADTLRRFREARLGGAPAAELATLAQTLDDGLADRLRRAEVSAGEARQIESAIVALTLPDEAQRAERLRQWAATELATAGPADPRQAAFERAQGEILAAWSARPPASRDRAALERELETLRQQTFATGTR